MRLVSNPPNPWRSDAVEWLESIPATELRVFEQNASSALQANDSPDVPFRLGLNPYRGCQHACAYCYARPTHEYLDFGAGTDFDSQLVVKVDLVETLRRELSSGRRKPEVVGLSGITDCYQPIEATYALTRGCLEALADFRWPVGIITKGVLIERDLEVLTRLRDRADLRVFVSIPFARDDDSRRVETGAPPSSRRFKTIERLAEAGVDVGVAVSPVIPGWTDHEIPELLERARMAGASRAFMVLLRLPGVVLEVFEQRMRAIVPERADKILSLLRGARGGRLQDTRFGHRMRGEGPRFDMVEKLFRMHCRRLGLAADSEPEALDGLGRPRVEVERGPSQGSLFDLGGAR
ncbi:MAG: radical SAM protein [Planctomycetota bacterium]